MYHITWPSNLSFAAFGLCRMVCPLDIMIGDYQFRDLEFYLSLCSLIYYFIYVLTSHFSSSCSENVSLLYRSVIAI